MPRCHLARSRHWFLAEVDRHAVGFVVEDRYEFEPCVERFEVVPQCRHPDVLGVLELRHSALGDFQTPGDLDITQRYGMTELVEVLE